MNQYPQTNMPVRRQWYSDPAQPPQQGQSTDMTNMGTALRNWATAGAGTTQTVQPATGATTPYMGGAPFGGGAAPAGAGGAAGGGAGGSGSSMVASAGPWAALALAILGNEHNSKRRGFRSDNDGQYARHLLSGHVLTQDIDKKWGPSIDKRTGGKFSDWGLKGDAMVASQAASLRPKAAWDSLTKESSLAKALRKIF